MTNVKVRKIGNSAGFLIPKEEMERMKIEIGQELRVEYDEGALIILPTPPTLDELIASVPDNEKFTEAETGSSQGSEE